MGDQLLPETPNPYPDLSVREVSIQVRSHTFVIPLDRLQRFPTCRVTADALATAPNSEHILRLHYNRNAHLFEAVVDFLLYDQLHLPHGACWRAFQTELTFWRISEECLSPCCWDQFMKTREQDNAIVLLRQRWYRHQGDLWDYLQHRKSPLSIRKLRRSIWMFVSQPDSSRAATVWSLFFIALVLVTCVILAIDTHPSMRVAKPEVYSRLDNLTEGRTKYFMANSQPHRALIYIEFLITVCFVVELFLSFSCCPYKREFLTSVWNWVQYLSLIPSLFLLYVFFARFDVPQFNEHATVIMGLFFRVRIFRILFLSRLGHYCPGLRVMFFTLKTSLVELSLLLILLAVASLFYGSAMFFAEISGDYVQSVPHGMWWAVITMTTVGYGDITPQAAGGFILGSTCALTGILIISLPIPVVANNFSRFYTAMKTMRRITDLRLNRVGPVS